eukprot:gene2549-5467_t
MDQQQLINSQSESPMRRASGGVTIVTSNQRELAQIELQELEASMADIRKSIAHHASILKELRLKEDTLQNEIFHCKQRHASAQDHLIRGKKALEKQDLNIRELQTAYERAVAERIKLEDEFKQVMKLSSSTGNNHQSKTINDVTTRYELSGTHAVRSGQSQDPLSQDPVPTLNRFKLIQEQQVGKPSRQNVQSINDIGTSSPSPYVRNEDFKVQGARPTGPSDTYGSARFSDWRRPGSRAQQPPGGRSQMSQIFG